MLVYAPGELFLAAGLFILGIKRMSSPVTARKGIVQAGIGMVIATLATSRPAAQPRLIVAGIAIGVVPTWLWGKKVAMTDMPQMVALSTAWAAARPRRSRSRAVSAAGAVTPLARSRSRSSAADRLDLDDGLAHRLASSTGASSAFTFGGQQLVNFAVFAAAVLVGATIVLWRLDAKPRRRVFLLALAFGVMMTLPIGGADMPVVISLYNALTGLAVAFEGYVMQIEAMIIAGTVVGAAGTFLTQLMARAMNRPLSNVLFSGFGDTDGPDAAAPPVSPKPLNSTFASERFIALAISCVSSVPAEPTTVPAMIIAALSSTKPSNATARPVNALYSEITTGMSAPPIGSVIVKPSTSASTNSIVMCRGHVLAAVQHDDRADEHGGDE